MSGIFITGVGTDVGKTYVTLYLAYAYHRLGHKVAVYKPIQTGIEQSISDIGWMKQYLPDVSYYNTYSLTLPSTPSLAFEVDGVSFSVSKILDTYNRLTEEYDIVLVEGAGGLFVPVWSEYLIADLIVDLDVPTILVSQNYLGTINHTGLSLSFAQQKKIRTLGFLFNDSSLTDSLDPKIQASNIELIREYTGAIYLGTVPYYCPEVLSALDEVDMQKVLDSIPL